jgi:cytochrome c oxidase assembly factor CtaG
LRKLTTPGRSWFAFIIILIGWHDPGAYNASLRYDWLHDIEHISFFVSGLFYWWHVIGAGPRIHKPLSYAFRVVYLLGTIPFNMFLGAFIAFAESPIYTYYTSVPRLWGISVINDQRIGGVIMWIPGSMMYIIATLVIVARIASAGEREARIPAATD